MRESYVIRIYQRQEDQVHGIVEEVGRNKKDNFKDPGELWSILTRKEPAERSVSTAQEQVKNNVIKLKAFNETGEAKASVTTINSK